MIYTDQQIEEAIAAIRDGGQNRALTVRGALERLRINLAALAVPPGTKFLFGAGVPPPAKGTDGDVYDNILTGDRYSKDGGVWTFQYRAKGEAGVTPQKGRDYEDGYTPRKGVDYHDGADGKSAYQLWLDAGNIGSLNVFLQSLRAPATATDGKDGTVWHRKDYDPAATDGNDGDFWQTAVSLTAERRLEKVDGVWRKFYDNTGAATSSSLAVTLAIGLASVTAGQPVVFTAGASGGATPYSFEVTATNTATGAGSIIGQSSSGSWTPNTPGIYDISAVVTDSLNATKTSITRTVTVAGNMLPVAYAGSDITITLPVNSVQLMGSGTDVDGTIAANQWAQLIGPPNTAVLATASLANTVVNNLVAGTYQFRFTVTDDKGGSKSDDVTVIVNAQPTPTIASLAPASGPVGTSVLLTGTGFGSSQGSSTLAVNGVQVTSVASWSDTNVRFAIPAGATTGVITLTTAGGTATSSGAFTVTVANTAGNNVIFLGTSRVANELPRYYGSGYGPTYGYVNPFPLRSKTAYASNANYTGFFNDGRAGDDISAGGMLSDVELSEVANQLVVGKRNILVVHPYINNIHNPVGQGRTDVQGIVAEVKQAVQDQLTALKARATAKGAEVVFVYLTDPSTVPSGWTPTQISVGEQCVSSMRNWLRTNYQALSIMVLCDLCSDNQFFGLNVPKTSPRYLTEKGGTEWVHYAATAGHQFITDTFIIPALAAVEANQSKIIEVPNTSASDPVFVSTLEDTDFGTEHIGWETASITDADYSNSTTKLTVAGVTSATSTRTFNTAGTAQEYVENYTRVSAIVQVSYRVDAGPWVALPLAAVNQTTPLNRITFTVAGSHTISYKYEGINGQPLPRGDCNFDRWVVASRVPIGASSGTAPGALQTQEYNDDNPGLTFVGFENSAPAGPYTASTARLTISTGYVATVAVTASFTGTPEEGLAIGGIYNGVTVRYQVDGGAWQTLPGVSGGAPSTVAFSILGIAAGTHTITVEFTGSNGTQLPYGNCIFDFLRVLFRA